MTDHLDPTELTDSEIDAELAELERAEQRASSQRRRMHGRIDFLGAGATEALPLRADELALSEQRRALHARIDLLRAERSRRRARVPEQA
jgi:hypothetical protein